MDYSISNWIFQTFGNSSAFATIAKIFTLLGNKWTIIAIAVLLLIFKKTRKLGFYVMVACGVTYLINDCVIKYIFVRQRPFEVNPEFVKLSELAGLELPDGYSMPSGHSAVAMALAMMVFMFSHKYGIIAIISAIFVGGSRVALCVHYLSDVFAGFAVGIIFAVCTYFALNLIFKLINKKITKTKKTMVFASNNKHKLEEVRAILNDFNIMSLSDIGFDKDIEENGTTSEENAKIKAREIAKYLKEKGFDYPVFSDDSGLFVESLNGEPGVYSARYAKSHDDEANRQKVLGNLKRKRNRNAYFECVICFIDGEREMTFSGKTYGKILKEYAGDTSFGYDCIFYSDDLNKSFGEANKEEKDSVSHRGRAVEKLKEYLKNNK